MKNFINTLILERNSLYSYKLLFIGFSVIFALGFGIGIIGASISPNYSLLYSADKSTYSASFTAFSTITKNNVLLALSLLLGFMTFGLYDVIAVLYNGIILGNIMGNFIANGQTAKILYLTLPHGILEIGWIIAISTFATQIAISFFQMLRTGLEDRLFFKQLFSKSPIILLIWVIAAAAIESALTPFIANTFNHP